MNHRTAEERRFKSLEYAARCVQGGVSSDYDAELVVSLAKRFEEYLKTGV